MNKSKPKRRTKKRAKEDRRGLIRLVALEGGVKSKYKAKADKRTEISWASLRRDLDWFVDKKFLKVGKGPRGAKPHSLTLRGLIYALKIGALSPIETKEARLKNGIQLPAPQFSDLDLEPLVRHVESTFPEYFYGYFRKGVADLTRVNDRLLAGIIGAMAGLTLSELHRKRPELVKEFIKGKNYVLPDGTVYEDFVMLFPALKMFGLTFQ